MISPLIYDPSWNKQQLFAAAKHYATAVLALWHLGPPMFHDTMPRKGKRTGSGGTHFGLYLSARFPKKTGPPFLADVYVNVAESSRPVVKNTVRRYSYPGGKSDRTAAGILCHEVGHYVQDMKWQFQSRPDLMRLWLWIVKNGKRKECVTGYEPVPSEAFAESMRLYILNPMLLRAGSPSRFVFINRDLNLPVPHETPWQVILKGAAPNVQQQAYKWTENKHAAELNIPKKTLLG